MAKKIQASIQRANQQPQQQLQQRRSRKKTTHLVAVCTCTNSWNWEDMMTHCVQHQGRRLLNPLEVISDPHARVYEVPLARTVNLGKSSFFSFFALISSEGVAIRNNDRTNQCRGIPGHYYRVHQSLRIFLLYSVSVPSSCFKE